MRLLLATPTSSDATRESVAVIIGVCGLCFITFVLWKLRRKLSCCYRRPPTTYQEEVLALAALLYGKEADLLPPPPRHPLQPKPSGTGSPSVVPQHAEFSIKAFPAAGSPAQQSCTPEDGGPCTSSQLRGSGQQGSPPRSSLLDPTTQQLGCRWSPSGLAPSAPPPSPEPAWGKPGLAPQLSSGASETSKVAAANLQRLSSLLESGGRRSRLEGGAPSSPSLEAHRSIQHALDSGVGAAGASLSHSPVLSTSPWSTDPAALPHHGTTAHRYTRMERQLHFSLPGGRVSASSSLTGMPGRGVSREWLLESCDELDELEKIAELPSEGRA